MTIWTKVLNVQAFKLYVVAFVLINKSNYNIIKYTKVFQNLHSLNI